VRIAAISSLKVVRISRFRPSLSAVVRPSPDGGWNLSAISSAGLQLHLDALVAVSGISRSGVEQ
jgi:hypothetical protein